VKIRLFLSALAITGGLSIRPLSNSPLMENLFMWLAVVLCGTPILQQAIREVKQLRLGIQTLITIAVIGSVVIGENVEAAAVVFLFQLGSMLEGRALKKTRNIVRRLFSLFPETAVVIRYGSEQVVTVDEIRLGDTVFIRAGDKIPVDGKVLSGTADMNESAITGESLPVVKITGDYVLSGTIVQSGYLQFSADKIGDDTVVAQMIRMIEDAEATKTQIQRVLDHFAMYYTPAIALLALLIYAWTRQPIFALTLLVVACPGALVIATPVSVVSGVGRAARDGILIKGGASLERAARIDTIAFDKTGTLTTGNLQVTRVIAYSGSESDLLRLVATAERPSEHIVGKAIVDFAEEKLHEDIPMPDSFHEFPGQGLSAFVNGRDICIGNVGLLREQNVDIPETFSINPSTTVFVAANQRLLGEISISDTLREDARDLIGRVRKLGVENVVMLTGDNEYSAAQIAHAAGIDQVYSGLLPSGKVNVIRRLQQEGHRVAMVGDGINDAPAMAAADAAITLQTGTGLALDSADIILMSSRLSTLYDALRLCKKTRMNIRENVLFAVLISLLLVLGASRGLIILASGMLIHEVSILIVIVNALRLLTPSQRRQPKSNNHQVTQIS